MIRLLVSVSIVLILSCCKTIHKKPRTMESNPESKSNSSSANDTTPKVTGIGGIFFFSENPKEIQEWYAKNLGLEINAWGSSSFESRNLDKPEEINSLQWTPFKKGSDYFAPSKKEFMINYRVQNIEGLVKQLTENGVTVLDSIATYDYGKFVHIMDAEGNKIELWEQIEGSPK
jgi:predicted enzyme related to lactoylglutathione lyase